jgi:hypothetical protein
MKFNFKCLILKEKKSARIVAFVTEKRDNYFTD